MILRRNYAFDIMPGGLPLLIRASKKDTSSRLIFSLFTGKGILSIPPNTTAAFRGKGVNTSASFSIVNGIPTVTVDLTIAMTAKVGLIPFEIVLLSSGYKFVTANLYLDVRNVR